MLRLGLGLILAALCLSERTAHAQAAPVQYLSSAGAFGFGDIQPEGFSFGSNNLPNGWFLRSERSGMGLNASSAGPNTAFGPFYREGVQFGYNFKDSGAPMSVYAGFDTLKSNTGTGSIFAPLNSSAAGFSANAGVEFKPTSNLSLSLGVGYTQLSGQRNDADTNAPIMSNENPYSLLGIRRP